MDQPKIERLLRLIKLLTANTTYTIERLGSMLDISPRSVYRYIDTFKAAGFVIHKRGDIYSIGHESRHFKDISQLIHFTDEEAYIVNQLIEGLSESNMLKQNLRRKLASVYNCTAMADCVVDGRHAQNINTMIEAIETKCQVVLHNYASSHTAKVSDRTVEPFAFTTNYVQAWCFDTEDQTNKLFSTARIDSVEITERHWQYTDDHHQGSVDVFRLSGFDQYRVRLELGVMAHNLLIEEYPLAQRDIVRSGADRWLLDTKVCHLGGVARFVVGLADDIKIVDSPELVEYIERYVKKFLG